MLRIDSAMGRNSRIFFMRTNNECEIELQINAILMFKHYGVTGNIKKFQIVESIHNMRKPVISSEISPKFDGVPTTDFVHFARKPIISRY